MNVPGSTCQQSRGLSEHGADECRPAKVAGVNDVVICSPAGPDGQVNQVVLAAAHLTGVRSVMRIGGAGCGRHGFRHRKRAESGCDQRPGNLYVTLAKQAVYGQVGIDSLAGPSEVLVIADQSCAVSGGC